MASCLDPVGTDDGGHGTHVAGTIGAARAGQQPRGSGRPRTDVSSPDYGDTAPYPREIDNDSCWDLPTEAPT